ncbi:Protein of unknown function [Zhouia amylolytica]|uniref:DUF3667 domain-containing protein n=1 Tax=Zhouia amylolytica TaxID=376730 RepID=A0A1I6URN8_9FLAO|nr:DUF3667 domain-containing protein [Zhouia amylolytica]SFT04119.1 Protein of unknown function [Zhouia amylolytica]
MSITCKNCGSEVIGKYCSDCGQAASTHRLNVKYIVNDIQLGVLAFDKGLFYTLKELFTRPGHTIRAFIKGKRVRHFKPLSLVILLATFYALLVHFLGIEFIHGNSVSETENLIDYPSLNEWLTQHYALVSLCLIPVFSMGSYIAFWKQGYNFIEHMVLNAYAASQRLVVHVMILPLLYASYNSEIESLISRALLFLNLILVYWCYSQFFEKVSKVKSFLLTVLTGVFAYTVFMVVFILWYFLK